MQTSERELLGRLQIFSRLSLVFGMLVSIPLAWLFPDALAWQILVALLALVVGIPHGAVDHLVAVPKMKPLKMLAFVIGYLAVTAIAIWFFLNFQLLGFALIVVISAIHFGVGDASFLAELAIRDGKRPFSRVLYAVAAGFTPVILPLVNSQSKAALEVVNPVLIGWSDGFESALLFTVIGLNLVAAATMFLRGRRDLTLDLLILLGISLFAPPLVAFALYFGLWHALRHTGRLTLELNSAKKFHAQQKPMAAFRSAVLAGVPALVIVVAFTLALGFASNFNLQVDLLWYMLVVVWALTIPHMALTAKLDLKAMRSK